MADKTDAEIVTALRAAIYALAVSGMASYSIDGQSVTSNDLPRLKESLVYFEGRANYLTRPRVAEADMSGNEVSE